MKTMSPANQKLRDRLVTAVKGGATLPEACDKLGIPRQNGFNWLKSLGIKAPKAPRQTRENREKMRLVLEAVRGGMSTRKASDKFDVNVYTVRLWCTRSGVKRPHYSGGRPITPEMAATRDKAVDAVKNGMSFSQAALEFHVHVVTVRKWCKDARVQRPKKEAIARAVRQRESEEEKAAKMGELSRLVLGGMFIRAACAQLGIPYSTARSYCRLYKIKTPSKFSETTGKPRRYVQPLPVQAEGRADTDALRRFAALVADREVKGMVSHMFNGDEWELLLQAKLGVQELVEQREVQ
jgi:transposase